jgi:steroid delta-isomerase-like uncharacterized protein
MSPEENKSIILRLLAAWNERDLEAFYDGFDAHCNFPSLTEFKMPPTLESFKVIIPSMLAAFPDMQNNVEKIVAEGDEVVARVTEEGTHRGTWLNVPATNKQVVYREFVFYRLANGKIIEWTFFFDALSLLKQLGVLPSQ